MQGVPYLVSGNLTLPMFMLKDDASCHEDQAVCHYWDSPWVFDKNENGALSTEELLKAMSA